jgi:hypothetical protein
MAPSSATPHQPVVTSEGRISVPRSMASSRVTLAPHPLTPNKGSKNEIKLFRGLRASLGTSFSHEFFYFSREISSFSLEEI